MSEDNKYDEFIDYTSLDYAEKIFELREKIVYADNFTGEYPVFRQGTEKDDQHELEDILDANWANKMLENLLKQRALVIKIARIWKGHEGVNYETTTTENLLKLIEDAVEYDQILKNKLTDAEQT